MLSIILYGRNDQHGYNYHKRLAISINCLAETLTLEGDEIVFVDFHSHDDFPTVIEAVGDTLTEKALDRLKVIRVRSSARNHAKNTIVSGEALSRNIAVRRTNPSNQWILSTNVDMIFVTPEQKYSLSELVSGLDKGFYQIPRFELPEGLWEGQFKRMQPKETLTFLSENAERLHLNTIVRRSGFILFDNPGDFQLMPREAIFEMDGFNEAMTLGWHVDSNLCKRMNLFFGESATSLENRLWGYHCNHTRQSTAAHAQLHRENSWKRFVNEVNTPYLTEQKESWGLNGVELEEVKLKVPELPFTGTNVQAEQFWVDPKYFNTLAYSSERIFPHLIDHFKQIPADRSVVYIGYNSNLLSYLEKSAKQTIVANPEGDWPSNVSMAIFDFGFDRANSGEYKQQRARLRGVMRQFLARIRQEKKKPSGMKFIGVNVLYNDYRAVFHHHLNLRKSSFLPGIAFGYAKAQRHFSIANPKKQMKFLLMYLIVRYFYRFSDKIFSFSFNNVLAKKVASHR